MAQQQGNPGTNKQVPQDAILDAFGRQSYLGNQYAISLANFSSAATTETPLFLLSNPAVSATAFPQNWVSLFLNYRKLTGGTGSSSATLGFYLNPTGITGGTTKTPINLRTNSRNTSVASLKQAPTGTVTGSLVSSLYTFSTPDSDSGLMIIDPGTSLLITVLVSTTTTFNFDFRWAEI